MSTGLHTERLSRPLQRLVDARLDTIDRMLLGRLPRADRLAVVRDVEGQILDLLGERPGHELDREDVLVVLARLDPPEAYLPEEGGFEATAVLLPAARATRSTPSPAIDPALRGKSLALGIVGLLLLGLCGLWVLSLALGITGVLAGNLVVYALRGTSLMITLASIPTFILSLLWRRGGPWAIVGLVASALSLSFGPLSYFLTFM